MKGFFLMILPTIEPWWESWTFLPTPDQISALQSKPLVNFYSLLEHLIYRLSCTLLAYVQGTLHHGILLKGADHLSLQGYSDSDWAACPTSRRSVTGYIILLGSSPISWKSKKQGTVSRSSSEAEYRAMAQAASEITWLVRLLEELGVSNLTPVKLNCDNQSALHIAKNSVFMKGPNTLRLIAILLVIRSLKACYNYTIYLHLLR